MNKHNIGFDFKGMLTRMPAGLDRAVLRVLSFHQGREAAISREALLEALENVGFKVHERALRACINQLRKNGNLICSTGGKDSGYWLATSWDELDEYIDRELHSRAMDLLEQEKALREGGERRWGQYSIQKSFFD